ncbi:MAG: hypothetical protein AAGE84_20190 [Cyanobacteria bacterium P01_G01_bin.39]
MAYDTDNSTQIIEDANGNPTTYTYFGSAGCDVSRVIALRHVPSRRNMPSLIAVAAESTPLLNRSFLE